MTKVDDAVMKGARGVTDVNESGMLAFSSLYEHDDQYTAISILLLIVHTGKRIFFGELGTCNRPCHFTEQTHLDVR